MAVKKIIRSSILFTLGNMLPLMASVVLLFPYTSYMEPAIYGQLAIYITFTLLLQILFTYGIDSYVAIHYFEFRDDAQTLGKFVGTILTVVFIIAAIVFTFFTLSGKTLFQLVLKDEFSFFPYGFMSLITAFCNAFFKIYVNFQFYRDKAKKYFLFNLFNFIITIAICFIWLYLNPQSIAGPMWGRLISGIAIFVLSLIFFIREYGISYSPELLKGFHKFCLPIAGFFILNWVVLYINNYIIKAYSTSEDVGIYNFAIQCTMLIEVVQTGTLGTINVRIYNFWKRDKLSYSSTEENRYYHVFSMFNILFIAFATIALPFAVDLLVRNENYYMALIYLPVLCAGFAFRGIYNAFYNVVIFQKKTSALPRALFITSVIQIVLCIVLVKQFGIWGAVWSFVAAKPIQALLLWLESRSLFTFKYNTVKVLIMPVLFFVFILLIQFLPVAGKVNYLPWLELAVAIILVAIFFRRDFRDIRLIFAGKRN